MAEVTKQKTHRKSLVCLKDYSGKIIVAIYDENDKLISTYHYTPEDTVNYNGNKDYSYARVMWWEGASFMKPMCRAVVTEK